MDEAVSALRQHQHPKPDNRLQLNEQPQREIRDREIAQEIPRSKPQIKHDDDGLKETTVNFGTIGSLLQRRPNLSQPEPFSLQLDLIQKFRTSIQTEAQSAIASSHKKVTCSRQEAYNSMLGVHRKLSTIDERGLGFDRRYEVHLQYCQAKLLTSALKEIREHAHCQTKNCHHRYRGCLSDSTTGDADCLGQTDEMDSAGEEWFNSPEEALEAIKRSWAIIEGLVTENNEGERLEDQKANELQQPRFQIAPPVQGWNMRINSVWAGIENGMAVSCDGENAATKRERKKAMKSYRPLNNIRTFLEKSSVESRIKNAERLSKSRQERRAEQFHTQPMEFIWSVDGRQRGTYGIEAMRMLSEEARKEGRICSWIMY